MKGLRIPTFAVFVVVVGFWIAWFLYVLRLLDEGQGFLGRAAPTIERLGSFGDAFGVLASLMAALAASAAFAAYLRQQEEVSAQEFERNFFTLLNNLQLHIQETDVRRYDRNELTVLRKRAARHPRREVLLVDDERSYLKKTAEICGRDAFRALRNRLRRMIGDPGIFADSAHVHRKYKRFYNLWHDDLGHYFRTLYHIFKMIDEACPGEKMRYARIVRAHLSSSEIILIAYNCAVGGGQGEFKRLLNKYAVLHNYHLDRRDEFFIKEKQFFERVIGCDAFGEWEEFSFSYP